MSSGYWGGAESSCDADDWFKTGDLALMESDGRLRLMGRLKELVIVSGFNVYPIEVEGFFNALQEVVECAAVGVPDDRSGEAVTLFVVLHAGAGLAAIKTHAENGLAPYKRPRTYVQLDELPKTAIGKIDRRALLPK